MLASRSVGDPAGHAARFIGMLLIPPVLVKIGRIGP